MTLVLNWASPGPSEYDPSGPHSDLVTLVLPGHQRGMVTLFPTGTDLILVTLVLSLDYSVPGNSGSTWASPVTGDSDPTNGLI